MISKIGTENAGQIHFGQMRHWFLRGVQLCGKSLPEYFDSIILEEGIKE